MDSKLSKYKIDKDGTLLLTKQIDTFTPINIIYCVNYFTWCNTFYIQFGQQQFDASGMAFGSQSMREYARGTSADWLHMQIGGGFERSS